MDPQANISLLHTAIPGRVISTPVGACGRAAGLAGALSSRPNARSVVELSLNALFRREYSRVYDAVDEFFQAQSPEMAADRRVWDQAWSRRLGRGSSSRREPPGWAVRSRPREPSGWAHDEPSRPAFVVPPSGGPVQALTGTLRTCAAWGGPGTRRGREAPPGTLWVAGVVHGACYPWGGAKGPRGVLKRERRERGSLIHAPYISLGEINVQNLCLFRGVWQ